MRATIEPRWFSRRQSPRARRWGYGISALVNLIVFWGVNVWPGWDAVPFSDHWDDPGPATGQHLSLLVGFLTYVAYLVADPPWFKALGNLLTVGISIAVLVRTLRIFPFDFGDSASTWDPIARGTLIFLIVASTVGLVVQVVQFVGLLIRGPGAIED